MSFGTGHHATTFMMISKMRTIDFNGKKVADFGTGTGVLAILAEKLGSKNVWAIDIDDWSIENATENIRTNACEHIRLEKRDSFTPEEQFDIILANINKNVILQNAGNFLSALFSGGKLLLSGLLRQDEDDVVSAFLRQGLQHISTSEKNNWICILFDNS
jgi:ribosomal protein L11 methyltransferase